MVKQCLTLFCMLKQCLTLFCREALKYDTFCREMLKTGTCGRENLDYTLWVKKWQICGESRLHILRRSVADEYSLTRGKLHNCLSYLSIIFAKTFLLPYLITSFTNSCSLFQMEFFFDNGWPLFLNSWWRNWWKKVLWSMSMRVWVWVWPYMEYCDWTWSSTTRLSPSS